MSESLKYPENKVEGGRKRMEERYKAILHKFKEDFLKGEQFDVCVRSLKGIPAPHHDELVEAIIKFMADYEAQKFEIPMSESQKERISLYGEILNNLD